MLCWSTKTTVKRQLIFNAFHGSVMELPGADWQYPDMVCRHGMQTPKGHEKSLKIQTSHSPFRLSRLKTYQ
jgi:hypothetical protein